MTYIERLSKLREASFDIKPFLQVADSLSSLDDVTRWLGENLHLVRHGHCQNIAALYGHVVNSREGVGAPGHVAFIQGGLVYDPIYFPNKTPVGFEEWSNKFPVNEKVTLIKLK